MSDQLPLWTQEQSPVQISSLSDRLVRISAWLEKERGWGGERSSLIGEAIRLIAECRPDFFIWENVKGVFSSNNGEDFWAVIQAFTNIGGYRLEWQLLNTAWFLPQNRERIYLIGHLAKPGRDFRGVFPIRDGNKLSESSTGETGSWSGQPVIKIEEITQKPARWSRSEKGKESRREAKKQGKDYTPFSDGNRELNPTDDENIGCITGARNKDSLVFVGGLGPHNRGDGSKSRDYSLQERVYDADHSLEAATISATMQSKYLNNSQIRRLTEIECERLQGFSDDWTRYGDYDGVIKEVAKTQRYKCLGNAVTVAVVREIGKRLIDIP